MDLTTILKILILSSIFAVVPISNGDPAKLPPNVQVAVLIPEHEGYKQVFANLYPIMEKLLKGLGPQYVEKQVAVATFNRTCLTIHQNFTSNPEDFSELFILAHGKKLKSHHDHVLKATYQTLTSTKLGWSSSTDVRKTLLIVTSGNFFLNTAEPPKCKPTEMEEKSGGSDDRYWEEIKNTNAELIILSESIQICEYPPWLMMWMKEMGSRKIPFTLSPFRIENGASILPPLMDFLEKEGNDEDNSTGPGIMGRSMTPGAGENETGTCEAFDNLPIRTQLAFVVDRRQNFLPYFEEFTKQFEGIVQDIQKFNADAEFAITGFTHYSCFQYPFGVLKSGDELETDGKSSKTNCYKLEQKFTTSLAELKSAIDRMKGETPRKLLMGKESSAQTAAMFTVTDKTIGWKLGPWDKDHNFIRKIIVFLTNSVTDIPANLFCDSRKRREPSGNGYDTCDNTDPPTAAFVGKVLREKNVRLVAVVADNLKDVWEDQLKFVMGIRDAILISVKKESMDGVGKEVVKHVKGLVSCDLLEADPPAYNTLGL